MNSCAVWIRLSRPCLALKIFQTSEFSALILHRILLLMAQKSFIVNTGERHSETNQV